MDKHLEILLVGTGAVGSYYGGRLAQAGARVATVCRSDYHIVSQKGIAVKSHHGDFHFFPSQVVQSVNEYKTIPDLIIVATKVLPSIDVPKLIDGAVHNGTSIMLLQNGIDIEERIQQAFPNNDILSALAFICVSRINYGYIEHWDYGRLVIGKYPQGKHVMLSRVAALFKAVGVECSVSEDIVDARWKKLLWNAPFNPMSVLCGGATTKEMIDNPLTEELAVKIMEEVALLAMKSGHAIDRAYIEKNISDTRVMKPYKTSMLLDYNEGRAMEVEAILGNALRIAGKVDIEVPHIKTLYSLLSLLDAKNSTRTVISEEVG